MSSRTRLGAVALAGTLLLAAGVVVATRPDLVLAEFPRLVAAGERVDPGRALLALVGTLLVLVPALVAVGRYRTDPATPLDRSLAPDRGVDTAGENASRPVVGGGLEAAIGRATEYETTGGRGRSLARATVVERLRPAAVDAYARREGIDEEAAREAVSSGEWTDEPRAAAFLGEPSLPLTTWLYDLFTTEDPYRRSLAATVEAIEAVQTEPAAFGAEVSA